MKKHQLDMLILFDQAELAEREIEEAVLKGEKLVIQPIVLFELVWVLGSAYGYRKSEVVPVIADHADSPV